MSIIIFVLIFGMAGRWSIEEDERRLLIGDIPDDNGGQFTFSVMFSRVNGDVFVEMSDTTGERYLGPIRFRSYFGGGTLTFIAEELGVLPRVFKEYGGQVPGDYERKNHDDDRVPRHLPVAVRVGTEDSRIEIKNIPDSDTATDEDEKYLDLDIKNIGDVTVTQRLTGPDEACGQMMFKTADNGGQNPVMAVVFTRIAERIVKASTRKSFK